MEVTKKILRISVLIIQVLGNTLSNFHALIRFKMQKSNKTMLLNTLLHKIYSNHMMI